VIIFFTMQHLAPSQNTIIKAIRKKLLWFILSFFISAATTFAESEKHPSYPLPYYGYYMSYSAQGHGTHCFKRPKAFSFSPDGTKLAVADTFNNRIKLFSVSPEVTHPDPLKLEYIYGGIWPWDNIIVPQDKHDAFREKKFFDGTGDRELYGRAYHGDQARIRREKQLPAERFNLPQGIAWLSNETMIISDTHNHRLKILTTEGKVPIIIGREGWKDGYFNSPLGINTDCEGNIYVVEPRSKYIEGLPYGPIQKLRSQGNRLQIFNKEAKPIKKLGHMHRMSGEMPRQFKDLVYVTVNSTSDVYLTDRGNNRILIYDENLNFRTEIKHMKNYSFNRPEGTDIAKNGMLAVADSGNHNIVIFDENLKIFQIIGGYGTKPGKFINPNDVKFGPNGDLYVLDTGNSRIQIFKGVFFEQFPKCPPPPMKLKIEKLHPPAAQPADSN